MTKTETETKEVQLTNYVLRIGTANWMGTVQLTGRLVDVADGLVCFGLKDGTLFFVGVANLLYIQYRSTSEECLLINGMLR